MLAIVKKRMGDLEVRDDKLGRMSMHTTLGSMLTKYGMWVFED